jgi:glycosyltransferase involved in cell wall biosynthesis
MDYNNQVNMKSKPSTLTALIIASNAERTIEACVRALKFCSRVIVGVNNSTDRTAALAKRAGAEVLLVSWEGYARTKNQLIGRIRTGWILSIDSDEVVSPELAQSIQGALTAPDMQGYWISRRNYFLGRKIQYCGWSPDWQLRLFRAGEGRFSGRQVHEALQVNAPLGQLTGALEHYSYANVSDYLKRLNQYTGLAARDRAGKGRRSSSMRLWLDPGWTFIKMYVIKSGWRDGFQGFALCLLSALNTLVKHAKHWELEHSQAG